MSVFSRFERSQTPSGVVQRGVAFGDAKPHYGEGRRLLIKGGKRDRREFHFIQKPLGKGHVARRGHTAEIEQLEISALRRRKVECGALERGAQTIALGLKEPRQIAPRIRLLEQILRN